MAALLPETEISQRLDSLSGWTRDGDAITATFEFKGFAGAMEFVNEVADLAEDANHHPDVDIRWNKVTLTLSTHSSGGLTENDTDLAAKINELR
ncbi:MAG: 4a-hydroxytetrahydrobiopterin dehydratase [Chthoniobacterales bacterium]